MPDHLHLLIQGTSDESRPKEMMDQFKTKSGRWLSQFRSGYEWQSNYYDHLIRLHEDWRRQAFYILNNPVRGGLAAEPFDYPYTGSIGYDLKELFDDLMW